MEGFELGSARKINLQLFAETVATTIKAAQYGLKGLMLYPVTEDTEEAYTVGTGFGVPTAQEAAPEADMAQGKIFADDTVYISVDEEKGVKYTITFAELPIQLKAKIANGQYDETLKKYTRPANAAWPTYAIRMISQFAGNGGWHVDYATVCDVQSVQMAGSKTTRSDSVEINAAQVVFYSRPRKLDSLRVVEYEPNTQAELAAAEADFISGGSPTP